MTRRVKKTKEIDKDNSVNRDFIEIVKNYKKFTTKSEWKLILGLPILFSALTFIFMGTLEDHNTVLLKSILKINQVSISVMAILAGFNTTSLAIIAASSPRILMNLNSPEFIEQDKNDTILRQLVSFFTFAIVFQLGILVAATLITMFTENIVDLSEVFVYLTGIWVRIPLIIFGILWMTVVLFALVLSLRNATLLYRYILFIGDFSTNEENNKDKE
ncbi:hypothetical protein [Salibacterium halotolerans]|uniref:Uncharacterized protein n=1 Tax=Salibacterium halotolerans TaxID=1884432 RepID=A0A1I5MR87_9BACI|nr:hypothetical protein [Salibacterium halotolerans]SFP12105.1 hypothetical protein SAMN05518683_102315 [Salibacterium halotolerans]